MLLLLLVFSTGEVSIDDPNFWQKVLPSFQTFETMQKDLATENYLNRLALLACFVFLHLLSI